MAAFPSTQWSLIRGSAWPEADRRAAFGTLVQRYTPAIRAYLRARVPAAQVDDVLQSFLLESYDHDWFARADAGRGSFRGFLLLLLRRHVQNLRRAAGAAVVDPEAMPEPAGADDPERAFDARFLLVLTGEALDRVRTDYAARGRGTLVDHLLPLLGAPPVRGELVAMGARLGIPANTLAVELKRLRARLADAMRTALAALCIDAETATREWDALRLSSKAPRR